MDSLGEDNLRLIFAHLSFVHLKYVFKICKFFKSICKAEIKKRLNDFKSEFNSIEHIQTKFKYLNYRNNQLIGRNDNLKYLALSEDFIPLNSNKIPYLSNNKTTKEIDKNERIFFNYCDERVNLLAFEDNVIINFYDSVNMLFFYPFQNSDGFGSYFFNDKTYIITNSRTFLFNNTCITNYIIKGERPNGDIESITIFFGFSLFCTNTFNIDHGRLTERGNWSQIVNDDGKCLFFSGNKDGNIMKINCIDLNSFFVIYNNTIKVPWILSDIKSVGFNKNNIWFVVNDKIYVSTESFIFEVDQKDGVWNNDMSIFYKTL